MYPASHFQAAIFSHCLWYFPSKEAIKSAFLALREAKVEQLAVAEWSLRVSRLEAIPHLLAVLMQGIDVDEEANVRLPISPISIMEIAKDAGWKLSQQRIISSPEMQDANWEVGTALAMKSEKDIVKSHLHALQSSIAAIGDENHVRTMDVWVAVFEWA